MSREDASRWRLDSAGRVFAIASHLLAERRR